MGTYTQLDNEQIGLKNKNLEEKNSEKSIQYLNSFGSKLKRINNKLQKELLPVSG
jgi:hypothetical protein